EATDATADRELAPQSVNIDEVDRLPEPAAGAVKTLAATEKAPAGGKWPWDPDGESDRQLPPVSPDPPIHRAAAIAAVVLILIAAAIWYWRRPRRSHPLAATAANAPARTAHLIDVGGVTGRSSYTLGDKLARVSRMPGTDTDNVVTIHIPEDVISRSHAFIELRRGAYWVTDPGSNNGTFVNGKRIDGSSRLKHGDVIKFASHEFRFEYPTGGAAADREVAIGNGQDVGEAATTVYAGGGADSRTTLAPQRADLQKAGATGADTDQDPTVVRPAS
ncbi:MAG: FHA domain-containing protein, partial [Sedimenticolaceae bacterium]